MARPAKSVGLINESSKLTKEEYEARKELEESLKSGNEKIVPPTYLSKNQKAIFNFIVDQLKASGILCNLDLFSLTECSIAIDRIQEAEKLLNENINNKDALKIKESYVKEFFRYMNELSLSPQSRAKMGTINIKAAAEKKDPLLEMRKRRDTK